MGLVASSCNVIKDPYFGKEVAAEDISSPSKSWTLGMRCRQRFVQPSWTAQLDLSCQRCSAV